METSINELDEGFPNLYLVIIMSAAGIQNEIAIVANDDRRHPEAQTRRISQQGSSLLLRLSS